jgi:hypothetical protein
MLKAPKGQYNSFGKYHYRSTEDILEAVKPLLKGLVLTVSDEIVSVTADRVYVKATAKITDGKDTIESTAFAREPLEKKGMDSSQITGATSSYARKYSLNGLFLIDDNKDADSTNTHDKEDVKSVKDKLDVIPVVAAPKKEEPKQPTSSFRRPKNDQKEKGQDDGI